MSSTAAAPPPQKRPSRSNSTSSSTTLRKPVSLSSRSAPRSSYLRGRSTSPDSISRVLNSLNSSRTDIPRQDVLERKPVSNVGGNRWSHSTSSSMSGIDTDLIKKRTSSSGATRRSAAPSQDTSNNRGVPKGKSVKRGSSVAASADGSRLNFQDSSNLNVVKDFNQASNTASSEFFAPAWEHRTGLNKFGEPVSGLSIQYTADPKTALQSLANAGISSERAALSQGPGHRDRSANKSKDQSKASVTSDRSTQSRKGQRSPKQKDMLSKALAKANAAVLLDNAQDIEGAIEAYNEACVLLEQVMARSADLEDRRKLAEIRMTYSTRIAELHDLDQPFAELRDKELPEDPPLDEYYAPDEYYQNDLSVQSIVSNDVPAINLPLRQESLLPQIFGGEKYLQNQSLPPARKPVMNPQLSAPMDAQFMPSPLAPRNPSPRLPNHEPPDDSVQKTLSATDSKPEATSWLDNVDGTSSRASSVLSSNGFGLHNGQLVSDIEAEFDAAMNAAIDTAYEDQGSHEPTPRTASRPPGSASHNVLSVHTSDPHSANRFDHLSNSFLDDEAEHEEKLLEQVTREYGFETPAFDTSRANPAMPRQSDSSGFSSGTWDSSHASTTGTSGTALSTLTEANEPVTFAAEHAKGLPQPPISHSRSESLASRPPSTHEKHVPIRDRRLSGQSAKQLKIETFNRRASISHKITIPLPAPPSEEQAEEASSDALNQSFSSTLSGQSLTPMASMQSIQSSHDGMSLAQNATQFPTAGERTIATSPPLGSAPVMPPPPPPPRAVAKSMSSSSLQKTSLTINTQPEFMASPGTPGSAMFSGELKRQISNSTPAVMTPGANILTSSYGGGMYLFDDQVGSTRGTSSAADNQPATLEPCPESFLLRPFWLMRCLCHALSHPHGGYVTQKLFIPRDIWRVRNVKIKALEDKVSQCDLLSAALQKLAQVDMLDAGAVLEEMQAFEAILDQARGILSKRLGNDVGVSGTKTVFSNSPAGDEADSGTPRSANPSSAAKSFASGWRKLRSKSSSANLNNSSAAREITSPSFTMQSLPMTSLASVVVSRSHLNQKQNPPPTPSQLPNLVAPHAIYLSSLARLFDAAQVLDSIARQVEDPGLKHSSQTHVGLELCVRNAAEFFAFYVVRFVMGDLLLLVDKFLKRGTEWVMT